MRTKVNNLTAAFSLLTYLQVSAVVSIHNVLLPQLVIIESYVTNKRERKNKFWQSKLSNI